MGFLADKITGNVRKYLELAIDLLTFAFAGIVMVYGGTAITKADHDPEHGVPQGAHGLHLRDRACDRGPDHDFQPDQRGGHAAQRFQ